MIGEKQHRGFIFCAALVYAGALSNLIDSSFYGLLFDKGMTMDPSINEYIGYSGLASFHQKDMHLLHGNVVDMLYFPVIKGHSLHGFLFGEGDDFLSFSVCKHIGFSKRFLNIRKLIEKHTPSKLIH
ncbi:MAG: signal peptidase II [Ferruginibacter sp.]